MKPGTVTKVLNDVFTTVEGELSLLKGDIFQVSKVVDRYWCFGNSAGKEGLFPTDKLIAIDVPQLADQEELFVAIADFTGEQVGDLSFHKGEFVVGEEQLDEHWWRGKIYSRTGVFPDTFTWHLDSTLLKGSKKSGCLNLRARVKMSLRAQLDEEMNLHVGDIVTIIEETDKGWYRGICGDASGIFPAAYVTILDDDLPSYDVVSHIRNGSSSGFSSNNNIMSASSSYSNIDSISGSQPSTSSDDFMTFSPEKEKRVVSSSISSSDHDILQDDYFKLNMPSAFRSLSVETGSTNVSVFDSCSESQRSSANISLLTDFVSEANNCNIQPYGVTLYPFYAQYANELSFHENEIVHLIRYIDDDWLEGEIDGRRGIFPVNYINVLVDCDKIFKAGLPGIPQSNLEDPSSQTLTPRSFAKVMYNFDAQMNEDLSVKESEIVMIMEVVDTDWCKVRNKSGQVGLCPLNHLASHSIAPSESLFRSSSFSSQLPPIECKSNPLLETLQSSRRKYETHDFVTHKLGENGSKVEDLISKNLCVLDTTTHAKRLSGDKVFIAFKDEIDEKAVAISKMGEPERCNEPPQYPPPPPPTEEMLSSLEQPPSPLLPPDELEQDSGDADVKTVEPPHHITPSLPPDVTLRQRNKTYPDKNANSAPVRRSAPPIPGPPARPPPPVRRVSIDRAPHRPAPPIPIPGQTPVRRSIRRLPRQTSAPCVMSDEPKNLETIQGLVQTKENQLQELQMVREEIDTELEHSCENHPHQELLHQRGQACDNQIRRLKLDIKHYKETLDAAQSRTTNSSRNESATAQNIEERRNKMSEQRQNVISELVMTEKEYVRDLKMTYEVFNLHNPAMLEDRGIDVKALFGNILEVMHVAEDLLDGLQRAMKGRLDQDQCIGPVFLEHAESIKRVYSEYCTNHEHALSLLEKYKTIPEAQSVLDKGMETLRHQVTCFNVGSVLIKPVQRLLKYPLILNELIKSTEDDHKDKPELLKAVKAFTSMASDINEYKRRKDIVSKYLGDGTSTLARRMAKLNLHSVAKKSSRLGAKLSSSLGYSMAPKDEAFLDQERIFRSLERTIPAYLRNLDTLMNYMTDEVTALFHIGELLATFYLERNRDQDVDEFRTTQRLILSQYWQEFKSVVERRVTAPLTSLLELFEGPTKLIDKRNDKLLDYDNCLARAEKNKESRQVQEELLSSKNNYEALNHQLLEELPKLTSLSIELLVECLSAFVAARKLLSGKITKQYLSLIEIPALASSAGDVLEVFSVKHALVCNQLGRFSFSSRAFREAGTIRKSLKVSPTPARQLGAEGQKLNQSSSQCAYLQGRYPADKLFRTTQDHKAADPLDLALCKGHLVGVIKKQDPMGNTNRWFVDNGVAQGFVRSNCLEPAPALNLTTPPSPATSISPCSTPSPNKLRPSSAASITSTRSNGSGKSPRQSLSPSVSPVAPSKPSPPSKIQSLPPSYEEVTRTVPTQPRYDEVPDDDLDDSASGNGESNIYEEISVESENPIYDEIPAHASCTDLSPDAEFYYSLYDFPGMGPHTLPLKNGQVVNVQKRQDLQGNSEWWLVENRFGKKGYVPANYLHPYSGD